MIGLLRRGFPTAKSPAVISHIYYFMVSFTLCYLYYHKFISKADFFSPTSSGGIYAVLNHEAIKPIQFRLLIPWIFSGIKAVLSIFHTVPDKALFFMLTIVLCYLILVAFYYLLCEYFESRAMNSWLSAVIIYPMIWNFVIMNGQFFYMDFSILLIIILGFYFIVSEKYNWLILVFFLGTLNHPSVGYLVIAFLLYNYNKLFKIKTIAYAAILSVIYLGVYKVMDLYFGSTPGYFVIYNLSRNLGLPGELPIHIIIRNLFFNWGGLHVFLLLFILGGAWKRYRGPLLYINLVSVPYILSVLVNFSIEEIRNYITIIPFILIPSLLFLSAFDNSFLRPVKRLYTREAKK